MRDMRYLFPILLVTGALLALDYYVYRNWRRFVREQRGRLRWTLPVYRVLMCVMPFALPVYFNLFRWWEVEPRLARAAFFGFLSLYYLPKIPIVLVLGAKDLVRLVRWMRERIRSVSKEHQRASGPRREADVALAASHAAAAMERTPQPESPSSEPSNSISRAEFLRRVGWTAAAVPFIVTGYGVFRTLYDFSVHRVDVPVVGLPRALEGLTIAQISDLHAGSLFDDGPMWDAVSMVNELKPDLVAVTGDFVNHDTDEMSRVLPALKTLRADLGIYGCLGNHDHYAETDLLVDQIRTTPIHLLVNAHRTLEIDGAKLHVVGTDNTGFSQHYADLPGAMEGIEAGGESAQILLAHDPTFWDSHVRPTYSDIDLMLCGHTHGGQFGFEIGPFRWSLAQVRYERWGGLYAEAREGGGPPQHLYVNRGIGTVGPPMRLGIPPEVTLLTLRRA